MYDLHGLSVDQAKAHVIQAIRQANAAHTQKIRFVTGRGKHANKKGERAKIYQEFPKWIAEFDYAQLVTITPEFGYYEVIVTSANLLSTPGSNLAQNNLKSPPDIIKKNLIILRLLADQGHAESQYIYATYLEKGMSEAGLDKSEKLAAQYMKKAAEQEHKIAMHEYARYFLHGVGIKQSDALAVEWLWKAHAKGVIESTASLAYAYANQLYGLSYDFQKAFELHTIAAAAGKTASLRFFGSIYLTGGEVEKNTKLAFEYYKKAADLGDAKAQFNIGVFYIKGEIVPEDHKLGYYYMKLSADNGDPDAQFIFGKHLLSLDPQFKSLGFKYLIQAAECGSESANALLASLPIGEADKIWLQRSAQAGNLLSQIKLDKLNGMERSLDDIPITEIVDKFRALNINEVCLMHEHARYQLLDRVLLHAKAKYRRKAWCFLQNLVEKRDEAAIRRLSYYYERGDGLFQICKDQTKVTELLELAVSLDDPVAMVKLAVIIKLQTRRVDRNQHAFALIENARQLHYPAAYYESARCLEMGEGVKQNYQLAYVYYQKALDLELQPNYLDDFIFGPLDCYQPIAPLAQTAIARLAVQIKPVQAPEPSSFAGLKKGFFQSPACPSAAKMTPSAVKQPTQPAVTQSPKTSIVNH